MNEPVNHAAIGAAFLDVLGDPAVAWRDTGAKDFIDRVASAARESLATQPAGLGDAEREAWVAVFPKGAPYWGIHAATGETIAGTSSGLSERDAKAICRDRALVLECEAWRKDDETPAQTLDRLHKDVVFLMGALARERQRALDAEAALRRLAAAPAPQDSQREGGGPVPRGDLVRHAIKLIRRMEPWDGKTFDPELTHTLRLLAAP